MTRTLVPAQQRSALRRAVVVDCQVVRKSDFALVASRGVDLSPAGMLVHARRSALTGESLVVSFRLPSSGWWFDTQAVLARVIHGRRPGDHGLCFGIAFEVLDPAVQFLVHTALQGVAPPMPKRELRIDYARTIRRAALT